MYSKTLDFFIACFFLKWNILSILPAEFSNRMEGVENFLIWTWNILLYEIKSKLFFERTLRLIFWFLISSFFWQEKSRNSVFKEAFYMQQFLLKKVIYTDTWHVKSSFWFWWVIHPNRVVNHFVSEGPFPKPMVINCLLPFGLHMSIWKLMWWCNRIRCLLCILYNHIDVVEYTSWF